MEGRSPASPAPDIESLPADELARLAASLGVTIDARTPRPEHARRIRERQALIESLSRDALLDVVVWMRIPVRPTESKGTLVGHILSSPKVRFEGLSDRGLVYFSKAVALEQHFRRPHFASTKGEVFCSDEGGRRMVIPQPSASCATYSTFLSRVSSRFFIGFLRCFH